jgi:tetratricopeptide (TPR) repeat protein
MAWIILAVVLGAQYVRPLMRRSARADGNRGGAPTVGASTNPGPGSSDIGSRASDAAAAVDPAPAKPTAPLADAAAPPAVPPPPDVTDELARATSAFENGDYARAIREYLAALKIDPNNKVAAAGAATARRAMQAEQTVLSKTKRAAPVLTPEARRLASQHVAEGQRLFSDGQYDAAIKAFEAALVQDSTDQRASDGIAQARKAQAAEEAIMRRIRPKPPS